MVNQCNAIAIPQKIEHVTLLTTCVNTSWSAFAVLNLHEMNPMYEQIMNNIVKCFKLTMLIFSDLQLLAAQSKI